MFLPLAYAEVPDSSDSTLHLVLIWIGLLAAAAILAFIPLAIGASRRHGKLHLILLASVLWGVIAAGSTIYGVMHQFDVQREQNLRLQTGYGDPQDVATPPVLPAAAWLGLLGVYSGLLSWAILGSGESPGPRDQLAGSE